MSLESHLFVGWDSREPVEIEYPFASVAFASRAAPDKRSGNEDAAGFWALGEAGLVLAVADGMGGTPSGADASATAIDELDTALRDRRATDSVRSAILDAFENANARILERGIGSGTTLVAVEIATGLEPGTHRRKAASGSAGASAKHETTFARTYHAGDSSAFAVGQRGQLRLETIAHSPVGYAVAAGVLEPDEGHHHDDRHLLSNCLGSREMRVEVGAATALRARDTLVLASDGVVDNVERQDLFDGIRTGRLGARAEALLAQVAATMDGRDAALPAHPDDATLLLYRGRSR